VTGWGSVSYESLRIMFNTSDVADDDYNQNDNSKDDGYNDQIYTTGQTHYNSDSHLTR
jgi:hypothetical protein